MINFRKPVEKAAKKNFFTGRYGPAAALLLIAVTSLLIYSDTLSYTFHWDDTSNIIKNPRIRDFFALWPPSGSRDVGFLSFALNYHFGGLDVFGYHIVNLAVHTINGFLVWWLVVLAFETPAMRGFGGDRRVKYFFALSAALIFISHPVQTQAVTYIVQRFASLAALFYLLSVALYMKARTSLEGDGFRRAVPFFFFSLLSTVCAMKTKEISFTLPLALCMVELVFFRGGGLRRLAYFTPFLLTLAIIPLSLVGTDRPLGEIIGGLDEASQEDRAVSRGGYLLTQFRVIITYIRLLFLPVNQNLDYDYPAYSSFFAPEVFLSFIFLSALFASAVYLLIRSRKTNNGYGLLASFGMLWFFLALSVESSIIPIRDVIFEHRLYLPSVGAAVAFTAAVFGAFDRMKLENLPLAALVMLLLTAAPLSFAAHKRNLVWEDGITLWKDVTKKSPNKPRGHYNLGLAYDEVGLIGRAMEEYKTAVRLKPGYVQAHNNLGIAYGKRGMVDGAIEHFRLALELRPGDLEARYNLGFAYTKQGRLGEAVEEYKAILRVNPGDAETHNALGAVYLKVGFTDKAIEEFVLALYLKPGYREAAANMQKAQRLRKGDR
ncbi:MAG: tetratricopeptide repeat protein [Thermodesulfobacteriota bacterium]